MICNAGGVSLYYEKNGNGKPLLLLHGNSEDHHIFDKISIPLANDFTVYSIDSRNHGQSAKTNEYSYDIMADDVYAFINELALGKVSIIGFSDGAVIALMLAMKHIDVIDKMALLGVNLKPSDFTEKSYAYIKETYEETKDPLFKLMLEQPNIDLDEIKSVNVPVLLIAAEKEIYKPGLYESLMSAFPNAKFLQMAGHKHNTYIIDNDMLYDDFRSFFS